MRNAIRKQNRPVQICYRWFRKNDMEPVGAGQWVHTPLPNALTPHEPVLCKAIVDDIAIANASEHVVQVEALLEMEMECVPTA